MWGWNSEPSAVGDVIDEVWNLILVDTIDEGTTISRAQGSSTGSLSVVSECVIGPSALRGSMKMSTQSISPQENTGNNKTESGKWRKSASSKTANLANMKNTRKRAPSKDNSSKKIRSGKSRKQESQNSVSLASVIGRREKSSYENPSQEGKPSLPRGDATSKKVSLPSKETISSKTKQEESAKKVSLDNDETEERRVHPELPVAEQQTTEKIEIPRTIEFLSEEPVVMKNRFMVDHSMVRKNMEHLLAIKEEDPSSSQRNGQSLMRNRGKSSSANKIQKKSRNRKNSRQEGLTRKHQVDEAIQKHPRPVSQRRSSRSPPQEATTSKGVSRKLKESSHGDPTPPPRQGYGRSVNESRDPKHSFRRRHDGYSSKRTAGDLPYSARDEVFSRCESKRSTRSTKSFLGMRR